MNYLARPKKTARARVFWVSSYAWGADDSYSRMDKAGLIYHLPYLQIQVEQADSDSLVRDSIAT